MQHAALALFCPDAFCRRRNFRDWSKLQISTSVPQTVCRIQKAGLTCPKTRCYSLTLYKWILNFFSFFFLATYIFFDILTSPADRCEKHIVPFETTLSENRFKGLQNWFPSNFHLLTRFSEYFQARGVRFNSMEGKLARERQFEQESNSWKYPWQGFIPI